MKIFKLTPHNARYRGVYPAGVSRPTPIVAGIVPPAWVARESAPPKPSAVVAAIRLAPAPRSAGPLPRGRAPPLSYARRYGAPRRLVYGSVSAQGVHPPTAAALPPLRSAPPLSVYGGSPPYAPLPTMSARVSLAPSLRAGLIAPYGRSPPPLPRPQNIYNYTTNLYRQGYPMAALPTLSAQGSCVITQSGR